MKRFTALAMVIALLVLMVGGALAKEGLLGGVDGSRTPDKGGLSGGVVGSDKGGLSGGVVGW